MPANEIDLAYKFLEAAILPPSLPPSDLPSFVALLSILNVIKPPLLPSTNCLLSCLIDVARTMVEKAVVLFDAVALDVIALNIFLSALYVSHIFSIKDPFDPNQIFVVAHPLDSAALHLSRLIPTAVT